MGKNQRYNKVCIVGLGYVGLPLAFLCNKKGYQVYGFDVDKEKIGKIKAGDFKVFDKEIGKNVHNDFKKLKVSDKSEIIKDVDIVIICVPTPVYDNKNPDLSFIVSAAEHVSKNLKKGQLVVVESTVYPGVTEEVILPILEENSGLKAGLDFFLSYCPERVDPGNKVWGIEDVPRIFGSTGEKGANLTERFYKSILRGEVRRTSGIRVAEAVKIVENTFRDVNIALVNELAKSFDLMGIDLVETIDCASTKPYGFLAHYPGCGVGGHCIPVDPYYLIEKGKIDGFDHSFLSMARVINNGMPEYTVKKIVEGLNEINKSVKGSNITVLGVSYKKDIDDQRNSPSSEVVKILRKMGGNVKVYDPYFPEVSGSIEFEDVLTDTDCVVVATEHSIFKEKLVSSFLKQKNIKLVVDGRNCLDKEDITRCGIIYKGIGR